MTDARYFVDFAPADAVQYDGTNAQECSDAIGYSGTPFINDRCVVLTSFGRQSLAVRPGQWLVRQGSRVWVQDEEPARVVKWEFRVVGSRSGGKWLEHSLEGALLTQRMYGGLIERRPVLSNGWTGPWLPVEGGAE